MTSVGAEVKGTQNGAAQQGPGPDQVSEPGQWVESQVPLLS